MRHSLVGLAAEQMEVVAPNVFLVDGMTVVRRASDSVLLVFDARVVTQWRWFEKLGTVGFLCVWPGTRLPDSVRRLFVERFPNVREIEVREGQQPFPVGRVVDLDEHAAVVLPDNKILITDLFDSRGAFRSDLSDTLLCRLRDLPLENVLAQGQVVSVCDWARYDLKRTNCGNRGEYYSPWNRWTVAAFVCIVLVDAVIIWRLRWLFV